MDGIDYLKNVKQKTMIVKEARTIMSLWRWKTDSTMAKDDYYVTVYKILACYMQLKKGKDIELEYLMYDGILFNINRKYWAYIFYNLNKDGYIDGFKTI